MNEPLMPMMIRSVKSLVPGYGHEGRTWGNLVSTTETLEYMQSADGDSSKGRQFDTDFIKSSVGIESVALTTSTERFVREMRGKEGPIAPMELFARSQSTPNSSLYGMLAEAVKSVVARLPEDNRIVAHIHIAPFMQTMLEADLYRVRCAARIATPRPIATMILQQGCSGLLNALDLARAILNGTPAPRANILITGENNMMVHAHQGCLKRARTDNINHWLWPAIFGEGVGALVVGCADGNTTAEPRSWEIDTVEVERVADDWRVAHRWLPEELLSEVVIRAREVRQTYMASIKHHAALAIEKCGGLDRVKSVCFHESNPNMVKETRSALGIPAGKTPSISARTGTLGCVSAFTLLERAIAPFAQADSDQQGQSYIVLALIGEAFGTVTAGHLILKARAS